MLTLHELWLHNFLHLKIISRKLSYQNRKSYLLYCTLIILISGDFQTKIYLTNNEQSIRNALFPQYPTIHQVITFLTEKALKLNSLKTLASKITLLISHRTPKEIKIFRQ